MEMDFRYLALSRYHVPTVELTRDYLCKARDLAWRPSESRVRMKNQSPQRAGAIAAVALKYWYCRIQRTAW